MAANSVSGYTIKAKIYITLGILFAFMLIASASYNTISQRSMVEHLVENQTHIMAETYFDSINTLMLTGGMANRDIPRQKLLSRPEVLDARIIRAPAVTKIYGAGSDYAKPVDDYDKRGLAGEEIQEIREGEGGRILTMVVPMPASKDYRGVDCIQCHIAPEGEILGAIRLDYSLKDLDESVFTDISISILMNSALMIAGLLSIGVLIAKVVTRPLETLTIKMQGVAEGTANFREKIHIDSRDEMGRLAGLFNQATARFAGIIDDTHKQAQETMRVKKALDNNSTPTTMSDKNNVLIYMNNAAAQLFHEMQPLWQQEAADFNVEKIMGARMHEFLPVGDMRSRLGYMLDKEVILDGEIAGRSMRLVAGPVYDDQAEYIGSVTQWLDRTEILQREQEEQRRLQEERDIAAANQQIKVALDNVSSSVMLANTEREIIYMNKTATRLFSEAEADIRQDLPNFNAAKLIGTNIDGFHKDPSHQMGLLNKLQGIFQSELEIGGRTMRIIANPVIDQQGQRLGTAVEWTDRTDEVQVEREIDNLIDAASAGDLERRLQTADKSGFFLQLSQGFNRLLDQLTNVFEDIDTVMGFMADGDLKHKIDKQYSGAFGKVKDNINQSIANVEQTVTKLREINQQVNTAADEISDGNANLSARTEQQAANLEETAASLEELTSTVKNNADNAQQANQIASQARTSAERGGDVVARAVEAMSQISHSSGKIAEIISVIDGIAFQTNLLALNASVEAARAGEQGRGFAVVANEVRNLASRSAEAAKEISALIKDSVDKVETGSELVNETGESLNAIVHEVKRVGDIIAEIAAASKEQSSGIDQINQAVTQMDDMTQQNAALAEETSAASANMRSNVNDMQGVMDFFR